MKMNIRRQLRRIVVMTTLLVPCATFAQTLTGTLSCSVEDERGGVRPGALASLKSPALVGGPKTQVTNKQGELRFVALPPGTYALDITLSGFAPVHIEDIQIGAGTMSARTVKLAVARADSVVVEAKGNRVDVQDAGFTTYLGFDDVQGTPGRHAGMFDGLRAAPGISPTSPSSGTVTTVSAAGSGTNENQFMMNGTNHTCTCNGTARVEPAVGFIQLLQVQSVGASAEFGNVQGAVVNVITRQGTDRMLFDMSYLGQTSGLTSRPVLLQASATPGAGATGYLRAQYRDLTTTAGGPLIANRAWFFLGYQYLRDADSQPGADPLHPREYNEDKTIVAFNWQLAPGWRLDQSVHYESGINPDRPTYVTPYQAISVPRVSVPAITFGHLTHVSAGNTVWEARLGRFTYERDEEPSTGNWAASNRLDRVTGVSSGAPPVLTRLTLIRTTGNVMMSHDTSAFFGADHLWKIGVQVERGEHRSPAVIPTGDRFVDSGGAPFQKISSAPSNTGGVFITEGLFATDAIRVGHRLTIDTGVRFDHTRALGQDLHAIDDHLREIDTVIPGAGTFYTWNIVSPRLGFVLKLSADGRTMLRSSYGRYSQGVLTGEIGSFSRGATSITTATFDPATQDYTRISLFDPAKNLHLDPAIRAPHTDETSIGIDREARGNLALSLVYVRKDGRDFIGWTDLAQQNYIVQPQTLTDGRIVQASVLTTPASARVFEMTNVPGYSLTYNGLIAAVEKRSSHGWRAFGSYTWSRAEGLIASSGAIAAGPQASTVAPPPPPQGVTFGRDPNDLINTRGLLPNDRTHIFRAMTSINLPRTGVVVAANLQYFTGKPWAATTQINLSASGQGDLRVFLEPRGTRRLSSQTLLDLRVSRTMAVGGLGRVDLSLDVLNALNDRAEEGLATDNFFSPNFNKGTIFMDPRRVMLGAAVRFGR